MKTNLMPLIALQLVLTLVVIVLQLKQPSSKENAYEYKTMSSAQMDLLGFNSVAKEEGVEPNEKGEFTFPKEVIHKISKEAMLTRTIQEVEADGGWTLVSITADNYFIFKRAKH